MKVKDCCIAIFIEGGMNEMSTEKLYQTKENEVYHEGHLILKGRITCIIDNLLDKDVYPHNSAVFHENNYTIIIESPLFNHKITIIGNSVKDLVDKIYEAELQTSEKYRVFVMRYVRTMIELNRWANKDVE